MTRRLALLALGLSQLALTAAQAEDKHADACGPELCQRRSADSATEPTPIAPNLEQGGAYDPFRVTIDGQTPTGAWPVEGDAQRATDKALAADKIQVQVTTLRAQPMLSVVAAAPSAGPGEIVTFHTMSNYGAYIARAELRIFPANVPTEGTPFVTLPTVPGQPTVWKAAMRPQPLRVVLRVYDAAGHFDETAPQDFAIVAAPPIHGDVREGPSFDNQRTVANIDVRGAEITISGDAGIGARVEAFGMPAPVDKAGRFVVQQIVPQKTKDVTVRVAPLNGEVKTYTRALNVPWDDHFLVAIADVTAGTRSMNQATIDLEGVDNADARKNFVDGRLAFYAKGQLAQQWKITAAADTGENPLNDLFSDFLKKDSRAFLRRLDPELHYPTYGDDSTLVQDAPTYGRFYLRAENANTEAMWGNFHTELTGTDLIRYSRALYGGGVKWHAGSTDQGEHKSEVNVFAADPGTIDSREEFASTGGSVYYMRNQDLAEGSERIYMEVRDRDSGIVLQRQELVASRDYDMNYIQGRILLRTPLPIVADTTMFVHDSSLAGNPVWLVATYEYTPGLTNPSALTYGGRGQQWIGDHIRVGVTGYRQGEDQSRQTLYGTDLLLRYKPGTYVRGEFAHSDGQGNGTLLSSTGGYDFTQVTATDTGGTNAFVLEGAAQLEELTKQAHGNVTGYFRRREAGYSGPGELTFGEAIDQYGGTADIELGKIGTFKSKVDITEGDVTSHKAAEAGLTHDLGKGWFGSIGIRTDDQGSGQANAYSPVAAPTNLQGERTDAAVSIGYRHVPTPPAPTKDNAPQAPSDDHAWSASVFAQKTLEHDGGRESNDRVGVSGDFALNQRLTLGGEVSDGDLGLGANAKANYQLTDRGSLYMSYQLDAENPDAFNTGRLGRLTGGTKYRIGDSTNVFAEERYEYGSGPTGFTQAYGADFAPAKGWDVGGKYEAGKLGDALGGTIKRDVVSGTLGYTTKAVRWSSALEYRIEDSSTLGDRKTWAARNLVTWQASDALRLFGKANFSVSNGGADTTGLDANYYELSLAAAYRPVWNDKLNLLAKLTYLDDLPSPAQVTAYDLPIDYAQRSKIGALDATYQLTPTLSIGGKVAYRVGELRMSRDDSQPWFDSKAVFWAVRADYEVVRRWDALVELRKLSATTAQDSQMGALVALYRHFGTNVKAGIGYNFTDYSDDLSDLSHRNHGFFFNVIGKF